MNLPRTIYAIQHNVTKKVYVGSTKNVEDRYMNHMYALRTQKHNVEDMQDDFNKYGENYSVFVLDEIKNYKERYKEYEYMKKYNSHIRGFGYNYKDNITRKTHKAHIPYKEGEPCGMEENIQSVKDEYIERLNELAEQTNDLALIDLICQLLEKENQGI